MPQPSDDERRSDASPDEVEQRQRPDGTYEAAPTPVDDEPVPSPDVLEQRQRHDGSLESAWDEELPDAPLSADMIEQRQTVEHDDEDEPRD